MSVLQLHSCVLRFLTRATFEPLQTAFMLNTSVKTVFLHSFVLTKRWNTWHALSIDEGTLRFSEGSLTLYFGTGLSLKDPGFNQAANPSSSPFSKVYGAGDRLLCPTRAPKLYLGKYKISCPSEEKTFFIPITMERRVSPDTIPRWIHMTCLRA